MDPKRNPWVRLDQKLEKVKKELQEQQRLEELLRTYDPQALADAINQNVIKHPISVVGHHKLKAVQKRVRALKDRLAALERKMEMGQAMTISRATWLLQETNRARMKKKGAGPAAEFAVKSKSLNKVEMGKIYSEFVGFYEQKRHEYCTRFGTSYGAEKFALEETVKEIQKKKKIKVTVENLRQAMTRRLIRRPLKRQEG